MERQQGSNHLLATQYRSDGNHSHGSSRGDEIFVCPRCGRKILIEKGNGNGNGKGKRGLIKTGHHILKTAVFGKNEWKVSLCNRCHSEYENYATVMEGIILRLFWYCYPALFILFIKKDGKPISRAEIVSLCLTEFFSIAFSTKKREILKSKLREQMMNNWIPEFEARAVIREELGQRYRLN